ncbi:MAG: GNAT family N-acetyltransferase [Phycisphaerales bacterium]|nr:GNAT family N-acetyltransferase [Phycisphaerales bacterium]
MMFTRRASIADIPTIGHIITDCAEHGLMLHRSPAFLYEHTRDFHVAVEGNQVIGCCGLSIVWANLAEVYSLAVHPDYRGKGIGKLLVLSCVDEAEELGIRQADDTDVRNRNFSPGAGYRGGSAGTALKVWSECVRCSKNQACDEIAMVRVLEEVPEITAPVPPVPRTGSYEVPVTLSWSAIKRPKMDSPHT